MCVDCGCHGHGEEERRESRKVLLEGDLLAANNSRAEENRAFFASRGIFAVNLLSSPGSGKTSLLEATVKLLAHRPVAVIEGDQQTANDADRIKAAGARAVQVNTGSGCHLEAGMVARAVERLDPPPLSFLFIENVGNLVCPALFDLGETARVVIVSVTEGEDKPEKYPYIFRSADLCLINKTDLLPHLDFDLEALKESARAVNPGLSFLSLSARSGEGMDGWFKWLVRQGDDLRERRQATA